MQIFKDKTVVIVGAGSGVGQELAISFAKFGAKLALTDNISIQKTEDEIVKIAKNKVFILRFDHSDADQIAIFAGEVNTHFEFVDILIISQDCCVENTETYKSEIQFNFDKLSVNKNCNEILPSLLLNPESTLVNISSTNNPKEYPRFGGILGPKILKKNWLKFLTSSDKYPKKKVQVTFNNEMPFSFKKFNALAKTLEWPNNNYEISLKIINYLAENHPENKSTNNNQ